MIPIILNVLITPVVSAFCTFLIVCFVVSTFVTFQSNLISPLISIGVLNCYGWIMYIATRVVKMRRLAYISLINRPKYPDLLTFLCCISCITFSKFQAPVLVAHESLCEYWVF